MNSEPKRSIANMTAEEYINVVIDLSEEIFHDFKNTLATISGIAQLTSFQNIPKEVNDNMLLINEAALECREQIDRFYKFIKGYNVDIYRHEILSNIVFTCLDLISHKIGKQGDNEGIILSVNFTL
ncbi:MAG: hypothetical protein RIN55_01155 [Tissierellaceae bacterium]|nr:hypothetical protein [Tissierellaceae bacterium]